jgi:tRNA 2-selenouridine synthase
MATTLSPDKFLELRPSINILDVRSPKEYAKGHIPGALSLPLFTDDERAIVGTKYTKQGKDLAVLAGLEFVGPKLAEMVRFGRKKVNSQGEIAVHCWRGGMRSASVAWLLETAGFKVYLLRGGYKAYRTMLREQVAEQHEEIRILGGMTGSGKTDILLEMRKLGAQVLDLEGYANHKGSAFGAIGQEPQPYAEMFENILFDDWKSFDFSQPIWIEDESKSIGRVAIFDELFTKMRAARVYRVSIPRELRVSRLVSEYASFGPEVIGEALAKIERRIGLDIYQVCLKALAQEDYAQIASLTLKYYDKAYLLQNEKRDNDSIVDIPLDYDNPALAAKVLLEL